MTSASKLSAKTDHKIGFRAVHISFTCDLAIRRHHG
jgi:hypothetical protein